MTIDSAHHQSLQERIAILETPNRSGNPEMRDSIGLFVSADLLYWWTSISGISFAIQSDQEVAKGKIRNPKVNPEVGFKVGLGAFLPWDGWDLFLNATNLHSRAPVHSTRSLGEILVPFWTLPENIANPTVDAVHGHWRLHFALIDLELGRSFWVSPSLKMRPHIGLRYGIIRQKYLIDYFGGTLFPDGKSYVSMKNKIMAPGLRAGCNLDWKIGGDFGLYSESALSILWGEHYVHESEEISFEEGKRFNIWSCFPSAKVIVDLAFGIQWEKLLFRSRYLLSLHFGYEQHYLFSQNQFFHFTSPAFAYATAHDAISLQGMTLGGRFTF